ncbi:class I SAM-dependent methyltransferase [Hahella sp. CR1]|uniref:class I SAM-dependent methyltransferase n=1 Tax=Hahella sp. CR1 TaxID=2992807 RepID=UPI002442F3CF|nr:class I SAM-dependent methyltransferase [Hahella sp. CR1]MDG9671067.1 class I SAM-dependent methyltransferase [Hahella sp. CR1]
MMTKEKFDGLVEDYDLYRPRYPQALMAIIRDALPERDSLNIADVGAGTGIALEGLMPILGNQHRYYAVDISADMIAQGRRKFPNVDWRLGKAEEVIPTLPELDLILAAQSFQWMDRPQMLAATRQALSSDGVFAVIQNNRHYQNSPFLDGYEGLLETCSPGYSRHYRSFDFQGEIADAFTRPREAVAFHSHHWTMSIPASAFVGMSRSSTQAQRALAEDETRFLQRLDALLNQYMQDGNIELSYESQLFLVGAGESRKA